MQPAMRLPDGRTAVHPTDRGATAPNAESDPLPDCRKIHASQTPRFKKE